MAYDFDTTIDRKNTSSLKWDYCHEIFGRADILPLWLADMDFAVAPEIIQALQQRIEHPVFGYSRRPESYDEALISWFWYRHNWPLSPEWLLSTPGVVPALYYAIQAFTTPGDKVLLLTPIYRPFFLSILDNQRLVTTSSLIIEKGKYVIDWQDIEEKIKDVKLLLLCNPHNPIGKVWSEAEIKKLGQLCIENNVIIVSDEIHCDLVYEPYQHIPTANVSPEIAQITVSCVSPSKTFNIPTFKNSTVVISNAELRKRYQEVLQRNAVNAENILSFVAGEAAYRYGGFWYDAMMDYITQNRAFLISYIEDNIPQISWIPPEGTFLGWLNMRGFGLSHPELRSWLIHDLKLGLEDGTKFGQEGKYFQRLNFACPQKVLKFALESISQALEQISETHFPISMR